MVRVTGIELFVFKRGTACQDQGLVAAPANGHHNMFHALAEFYNLLPGHGPNVETDETAGIFHLFFCQLVLREVLIQRKQHPLYFGLFFQVIQH